MNESLLTRLRNHMLKIELDFCEVVEIDLKPDTHDKILDELEQKGGCLNTLFGVPVIIDNTIPKDQLWVLIKRKRDIQ